MFRLFKILLFLNPFKLFSLRQRITTFRRKLQFIGVLLAIATALQIHIMPDWLATLIERATGNPAATTGTQNQVRNSASPEKNGVLESLVQKLAGGDASQRQGGIPPAGAAHPAPPAPAGMERGGELSRGQLFAAFANLNLRAEQMRRLPDSPPPPDGVPVDVAWRRIERVLDGNTMIIDGKTVRLIGIDAPEASENDHLFRELDRIGARDRARDMLHLGQQSTRFLKQAEGRRCWLQYEDRTRDQFGRILAYVHLDDGTNLNEVMLYQGFAKVYLDANFRYAKRYVQLQNEAAKRRNGLWAER